MLLLLILACHTQPWPRGDACDCADGLGVALCDKDGSCGPCMCLPPENAELPPVPTTAFFLDPDAAGGDGSPGSPWSAPDWPVVDAALADGSVGLYFSARRADGGGPAVWPERLTVQRTDDSDNRLILDGCSYANTDDDDPTWEALAGCGPDRAVLPGLTTGYDDVVVSDVTIRGFELTGSRDKGIYWRAGDRILIEHNLVHDNDGSPAINLDYSSRTGHVTAGFRVERNHIWNQRGECIYIGGSEGDDADSHQSVIISENIVHDCWTRFSSQHDGINIKDRLRDVEVRRNVVFNTDWGIEAASPGLYEQNLVFSTRRNGFHLTDAWGQGLGGARFVDNVVIDAGHAGVYMNASNHTWTDLQVEGLTVIGAAQAGIEAGGVGGISGSLDDLLLVDNAVGFDAWSPQQLDLGSCRLHDNDLADDRDWAGYASPCSTDDPQLGDLSLPSGPDLLFFTDDDPWVSTPGANP